MQRNTHAQEVNPSQTKPRKRGRAALAFNPITQEEEAGGSLWVWDQPGLCVGYFFIYLFIVKLKQTRVIREEGISIEKMSPSDWPVSKPELHFLCVFYVDGCFVCMYIYTPEGIGLHEDFIDGCESPYECWELNLGPQEEHSVLNYSAAMSPAPETFPFSFFFLWR